MRATLLLILFLIFISCAKSNKEKIEYDATDPSDIATSFHYWYLDNVKNYYQSYPIEVSIVKNEENGLCKVDFEQYFEKLRRIGTISERFITNEKKRLSRCKENFSKGSSAFCLMFVVDFNNRSFRFYPFFHVFLSSEYLRMK